ncbi:SDR family oxidoreductase [Flavobacterium sp. DG1-102-2]|uniref:SDR family oxidoreductase n=1 Tax=Flavobacterium sp. DG1-102-2 TaxID=3081663 RepID=UPI00294A3A20|nr:SDR family oxidoreductase [Flavobacterium sp. DG1-102-2]MDV6167269.1 SDR family oxidoreductase [Flavobacterium sp. DG1-102-2]
MQKTIFITGASSGLGKAAAKLFVAKGWHVIATMRNPHNETELTKMKNVTVVSMDVTLTDQIESVISDVLENYNVDVVLNNAGYGLIGPLESFSAEQIQKQIATNLSGVINVTKSFLSHFRNRQAGTFINITSTFGLVGYPTCSIYNATKFAVDGFSEGIAYELAQFDIKVKIVAPGGMQTDFTGRSMASGTHNAYRRLIDKVSEGYSEEQIANYTKAEDVAQIIYNAATDGTNQLRYIAGHDAIALYKDRIESTPEVQFQKIRYQFVF